MIIWEHGPNRKIDLHQFFKPRVLNHQIVVIEDDKFNVMNIENVYTIKKEIAPKGVGVNSLT